MPNRFQLELFVTEMDDMGEMVNTWTVEAYDLESMDVVAGTVQQTGKLIEAGEIEPDEFDDADYYDDDFDYDYYDDEAAGLGADTIDPYE